MYGDESYTGKYYYGITMKNGQNYTIESDEPDLFEFMKSWGERAWFRFTHYSEWKIHNDDLDYDLQFDSVIIRVADISSICCMAKKEVEDEF